MLVGCLGLRLPTCNTVTGNAPDELFCSSDVALLTKNP